MTGDPAAAPDPPAIRYWPPHRPLPEAESVAVTCGGCACEWRVHRALCGFRLRCECHAWVAVPLPPQSPALPPPLPTPRELADPQSHDLAAPVSVLDGDHRQAPRAAIAVLHDAPLAVQRRWIDRTVIEVAAIMAALVGPPLLLDLVATGSHRALGMPLASLASCALVLTVAHANRRLALSGLRRAPAWAFGESALVTVVAILAALGWLAALRVLVPDAVPDETAALRRELGLPLTLFVNAACPALLEEIAFRGLVLARLVALMGPTTGAVTAGAMFALAHGVTLGFPLHAAGGIYLSFLRLRSQSLWPGIMLHFGYNAVLTAVLD